MHYSPNAHITKKWGIWVSDLLSDPSETPVSDLLIALWWIIILFFVQRNTGTGQKAAHMMARGQTPISSTATVPSFRHWSEGWLDGLMAICSDFIP